MHLWGTIKLKSKHKRCRTGYLSVVATPPSAQSPETTKRVGDQRKRDAMGSRVLSDCCPRFVRVNAGESEGWRGIKAGGWLLRERGIEEKEEIGRAHV